MIVDSSRVYKGFGYGWLWACSNWPKCDAYVGCHGGTRNPLGRLANEELRAAKSSAHAALDRLWKPKRRMDISWVRNRRKEAYTWLAKTLGIEGRFCHIGMFDVETCQKAVAACVAKLAQMKVRANLVGS